MKPAGVGNGVAFLINDLSLSDCIYKTFCIVDFIYFTPGPLFCLCSAFIGRLLIGERLLVKEETEFHAKK